MARKERSPAYPHYPLETAIEHARSLYEKQKTHRVSVDSAATCWMRPGSSTGSSSIIISTLKQYGLLVDEGRGQQRKVGLSDMALGIIRDPRRRSSDRDRLLRGAAWNPGLFHSLFEEYDYDEGGDLPSKDELEFNLRRRGFSDAAAQKAVHNLRATIDYVERASDAISATSADSIPFESEEASSDTGLPPSGSSGVAQVTQPTIAGNQVFEMHVPLGGTELRGMFSINVPPNVSNAQVDRFLNLITAMLDGLRPDRHEDTECRDSPQ